MTTEARGRRPLLDLCPAQWDAVGQDGLGYGFAAGACGDAGAVMESSYSMYRSEERRVGKECRL